LLDPEHVEVVPEAARAVEPATRGCDPVELVAAAKVLGALRAALDELEHEDTSLRQIRDHGRSDTRLRCCDAVLVLVLAVDGEQARVLGRDADDVGAPVDVHLVVRIGEAARQLGDGTRAGKLGNELEDFVDLRAALHVA
jgi:hypothetical protein